jgi:hypothetical protein
MHDLFKVAKQQQFSSSLFKNIVHKYVKNGIANEMINSIEKGNIISLESINLPIKKILMERFDWGFDGDILTKDGLIQEIDIKSNAYKAGLRNGQKVTHWSSQKEIGNPDQIITITTTVGTFKFRPEHWAPKIEIYQLKEDISLREEKQFNKFFGIK